ncbi:unnamed protein product [Pedinophyceae sp. YPF-701]|nr:unnamed protein product [Pedinophyceae sp. YPF-701]
MTESDAKHSQLVARLKRQTGQLRSDLEDVQDAAASRSQQCSLRIDAARDLMIELQTVLARPVAPVDSRGAPEAQALVSEALSQLAHATCSLTGHRPAVPTQQPAPRPSIAPGLGRTEPCAGPAAPERTPSPGDVARDAEVAELRQLVVALQTTVQGYRAALARAEGQLREENRSSFLLGQRRGMRVAKQQQQRQDEAPEVPGRQQQHEATQAASPVRAGAARGAEARGEAVQTGVDPAVVEDLRARARKALAICAGRWQASAPAFG